jgi:2-hydroxy-3-keto-5-methylthiopentenyl-1-phosphate phosphatase
MWGSVTLEWDDALLLLESIEIDKGWDTFYEHCQVSGIPIVVVSRHSD